MRKITALILGLILGLTLPNISQAQTNAGFVSGIWFSHNPVFADQETRIYIAIQNQSNSDLTGNVYFYIDESETEKKEISILSGRLVESWVDWIFPEGDHKVRVEIKDTFSHPVGGEPTQTKLVVSSFEKEFFVDLDTDGDGVGDREDEDDDNDFLPDREEEKEGTDLKNPDTDGDGLLDGRDSQPLVSGGAEQARETSQQSVLETAINIGSQINNSADPVTQKLIDFLEERRSELAGARTTQSGEQGDSQVASTLQSGLLNFGIFLLRNWLVALVVVIVLYLFWKAKRRFGR